MSNKTGKMIYAFANGHYLIKAANGRLKAEFLMTFDLKILFKRLFKWVHADKHSDFEGEMGETIR